LENKIAKFIFDGVGLPKVEKFLNLSSTRHKLVSDNIANAATPGYRSRQMDFKAELASLSEDNPHLEGKLTQPGHIPLGYSMEKGPEIEAERPKQGELNSVDIDKEISNLAQNELMYTIGAQIIRDKFEGLRKVITSR
jgi:flagellar basal-body rod protein FlgB